MARHLQYVLFASIITLASASSHLARLLAALNRKADPLLADQCTGLLRVVEKVAKS